MLGGIFLHFSCELGGHMFGAKKWFWLVQFGTIAYVATVRQAHFYRWQTNVRQALRRCAT